MRIQTFLVLAFFGGLLNGCASGQTQADDASQRPKNRCDSGLRCGGPVDVDGPSPKAGKGSVIIHE